MTANVPGVPARGRIRFAGIGLNRIGGFVVSALQSADKSIEPSITNIS
jgi:hypothetical protein